MRYATRSYIGYWLLGLVFILVLLFISFGEGAQEEGPNPAKSAYNMNIVYIPAQHINEVRAYNGKRWAKVAGAGKIVVTDHKVMLLLTGSEKVTEAIATYGWETGESAHELYHWNGEGPLPFSKKLPDQHGELQKVGLSEVLVAVHDSEYPEYIKTSK